MDDADALRPYRAADAVEAGDQIEPAGNPLALSRRHGPHLHGCREYVGVIEQIMNIAGARRRRNLSQLPGETRWNDQRNAVEFGVEIGEYAGVIRVPHRPQYSRTLTRRAESAIRLIDRSRQTRCQRRPEPD